LVGDDNPRNITYISIDERAGEDQETEETLCILLGRNPEKLRNTFIFDRW